MERVIELKSRVLDIRKSKAYKEVFSYMVFGKSSKCVKKENRLAMRQAIRLVEEKRKQEELSAFMREIQGQGHLIRQDLKFMTKEYMKNWRVRAFKQCYKKGA